MNLLEFENQRFNGLWNTETIKELKEFAPCNSTTENLETNDYVFNEMDEKAYREFQQSNFEEYFTSSYIYCLFK